MAKKNNGYSKLPDMIFELQEQKMDTGAALVYAYLCRCSNGKGQCFPSYRDIAEKCYCSESTAIRAIRKLINLGLIRREKQTRKYGGQTSNLYTIHRSPQAIFNRLEPPGVSHRQSRSVTQTPPGCHTDTQRATYRRATY